MGNLIKLINHGNVISRRSFNGNISVLIMIQNDYYNLVITRHKQVKLYKNKWGAYKMDKQYFIISHNTYFETNLNGNGYYNEKFNNILGTIYHCNDNGDIYAKNTSRIDYNIIKPLTYNSIQLLKKQINKI